MSDEQIPPDDQTKKWNVLSEGKWIRMSDEELKLHELNPPPPPKPPTQVVIQKWQEHERGWGVRPDGYSVHLSDEARMAYIATYWKGMPDAVPDDYSKPHGTPYEALVFIPEDETQRLNDENGYRVFNDDYPGSGGTDGWR